MGNTFVVTGTWRLAAPAQAAWELVADVPAWPRWWRSVHESRAIDREQARCEASGAALRWHALIGKGLRLRIARVAIDPFELVELLIRGDLDAKATWVCARSPTHGADVTCRWELRLDPGRTHRHGFAARLLLERSHFALMRAFSRDMGRALTCRVTRLREWSGPPGR